MCTLHAYRVCIGRLILRCTIYPAIVYAVLQSCITSKRITCFKKPKPPCIYEGRHAPIYSHNNNITVNYNIHYYCSFAAIAGNLTRVLCRNKKKTFNTVQILLLLRRAPILGRTRSTCGYKFSRSLYEKVQ